MTRMGLRREVAEVLLREVLAPTPKPRAVIAEIEKFMREKGFDEMKIAESIGRFWGTYFKLSEEAKLR